MEFDFASLLVLVFIPMIIFAVGALVQHREITKGKSKKLKIILISVILALALLMMAYSSFYEIINDFLPPFFDSIELFIVVLLGSYYVLALDIIFILGCFIRWSVYKFGSSKRKQ